MDISLVSRADVAWLKSDYLKYFAWEMICQNSIQTLKSSWYSRIVLYLYKAGECLFYMDVMTFTRSNGRGVFENVADSAREIVVSARDSLSQWIENT